jgi:hypothetical protein
VIPVPPLTLSNQPGLFDVNCRQPGAAWLAAYPANDPHQQSIWWQAFQPDLAAHFSHRCGWLGVSIGLSGSVDHYLACGNRKGNPSPNRHLAFEWTNYRYADARINSMKGNLDDQILDPCMIGPGWFEVVLPNFALRTTAQIPPQDRPKAEFTLKKLKLINGHLARWNRWDWCCRYWNHGNPLISLLLNDAPLVGEAVQRAQQNGDPLPDPTVCQPGHQVRPRRRPYVRQRRSPSGGVTP